jgi:phospho-N-acetylmuramoyl-pentapeptide-transferase
MEQSLVFILLTFAASMLWAPLLTTLLYKKGIVRHMDTDFSALVEERAEKEGTPIMGGLLIVISVVTVTLIFNFSRLILVPVLIFSMSAFLGGLDDILNIYGQKRVIKTSAKQIKLAKVHKSIFRRIYYMLTLPWIAYLNIWFALGSYPGKGLHAGEKIIVQIFTGLLISIVVVFKLGFTSIWFPWLGQIYLGYWMIPLIIFTVISMTNAVNIADGMDGLSAGSITPAFIAFMVLALVSEDYRMAYLNATTVGALLAYIYFNIKPARFQMGDVGSLALGSLIATIAILQNRLMLLPIVGFIFVVEIGSSLVQGVYRRIFGKRLIKMAPLHLHFSVLGWTEEKVVMRFWLFAIIFSILGIWLGMQ